MDKILKFTKAKELTPLYIRSSAIQALDAVHGESVNIHTEKAVFTVVGDVDKIYEYIIRETKSRKNYADGAADGLLGVTFNE